MCACILMYSRVKILQFYEIGIHSLMLRFEISKQTRFHFVLVLHNKKNWCTLSKEMFLQYLIF
jgi:hypothetical protein